MGCPQWEGGGLARSYRPRLEFRAFADRAQSNASFQIRLVLWLACLHSLAAVRFRIHNQAMLLETGDEFLHVTLNYRALCIKLSAYLIDDVRFRKSAVEELKDARPDWVEVEHLTQPEVQHYCAILAVGAANGIGNFVHRNNSLVIVSAHCDIPTPSNPQKGEAFR